MKRNDDTVSCRFCGGEMKRSAAACPHCGSDDRTGWSEQTYLDNIDLPEESEYQESVDREFGGRRVRRNITWQMAVGAAVLAAFVFLLLRSAF